MEKSKNTNKPESFKIEKVNGYVGIRVNSNIEKIETEDGGVIWEADTNFFWVPENEIDLEDLKANPDNYLCYIPNAKKQEYKNKAQELLNSLRMGNPVIPVPSYREGAKVCNRTSDQIKLLAGLQMGGLPYYELADGEIVSLTLEDLQKIEIDIAQAEITMQQGKQVCWSKINEAKSIEEMETAISDYEEMLGNYQIRLYPNPII